MQYYTERHRHTCGVDLHGRKSGNDRLDAERIARLLGSGMFPVAYVYPKKMRSTRDVMRRRSYMVNQRSSLITHIQVTNQQYNLPELGKISKPNNREGIIEQFQDPAVRASIEADLAVIDIFDVVIRRLERTIIKAARGHDGHAFALLKSVHGIGDIIGLTLLYEIHDIGRFDSLGGFLSYCRLIKCDKTSNGKKKGSGKRKQGNHHLKWAFSEAAALFLRANPDGKKLHSRLLKKHCKGKALGILAAKLARSVYFMLHRNTPFDMERFIRA